MVSYLRECDSYSHRAFSSSRRRKGATGQDFWVRSGPATLRKLRVRPGQVDRVKLMPGQVGLGWANPDRNGYRVIVTPLRRDRAHSHLCTRAWL